MRRSEAHRSLDGKLRRLLWSMLLLVCVILVATLAILLLHNHQYSIVTANIVRASQFNQNFKEDVDLKMYYYVIDSSYGETLPLQEVDEAKTLGQELLSGTQDRQSRKAITSAINLCENLRERIVQITETDGYEARMELLESNIYILTELIQQYFYTYLYHEAGYLDSLQAALTARLWLELGLVAVGALILVIVLMRRSAAISRSITQPIYALRERAQSIGRGDLAAREPVVAEDETLQALSSSLEQMAQHLQQQMELNRQEQDKLRAMELALLQSQINPHFLYNTLDTIIWLVETGKNEQAVEMVTSLSNFFRSSLSKGRDIITLGEEEIHVRSYLEIQQVRYRDILRYEICVRPELRGCVLPKLTLQPLVENALYHGIKLRRGMGHILIDAAQENGHVRICVRDDGAGMAPERLQQLRQSLASACGRSPGGFGCCTARSAPWNWKASQTSERQSRCAFQLERRRRHETADSFASPSGASAAWGLYALCPADAGGGDDAHYRRLFAGRCRIGLARGQHRVYAREPGRGKRL